MTPQKRLNYLLIMPRLVKNVGDGYSFPLGIAYVSSSVKKAGFNVTALNLNHREGEIVDIIREEIKKNKIDVVATGGLSFQYNTIKNIVDTVKEIDEKIVVIVGGGIITSDPVPAMEALKQVDFGVIGEGEITCCELFSALESENESEKVKNEGSGSDSDSDSDSDLSKVNGLIYTDKDQKYKGSGDSKYKITNARKENENIDSLPWPDYDGFELDKYFAASPSISGLNRKNTVFMIASRSCPYACTFCFHTIGRKYRQRSLDDFFAELDYMVSKYKIDFICLADELFARKKDRVSAFCKKMQELNIKWWAQFRVDDITTELISILKSGGCEIMSFGLESADNRVLKSMRKGTTVELIEKTLKLVYDAGMSMEGAFIFGDIAETRETAENTFNWWQNHLQYKINLNLITIYPGSYLYKYACEKEIIKDKVQYLIDGCPQVNVSQLSDEEFAKLLKNIMEAPMSLTKVLSAIEVENIDYKTGRVQLAGVCTACRERNSWSDVKLFSANFIACKRCGQKYNAVLPTEFRENLEKNVLELLKEHGKIATWGVNYHTVDLYKNSQILKHNNIFPIDISETKRKMDLYGKEINSPEIINKEGIEVVIVSIPEYYRQIDQQIKSNFKNVKKVIDICGLVNSNFR
ncbi:MAG: cobalamin-dependent protein [Oligoflexia bacterium]|nr:cobalamin-dependent protein [Oligoflexia bacterium]